MKMNLVEKQLSMTCVTTSMLSLISWLKQTLSIILQHQNRNVSPRAESSVASMELIIWKDISIGQTCESQIRGAPIEGRSISLIRSGTQLWITLDFKIPGILRMTNISLRSQWQNLNLDNLCLGIKEPIHTSQKRIHIDAKVTKMKNLKWGGIQNREE